MDSLIGIKGKDFIIIAADTSNAYSVLKMKVNNSIIFSNTMIKYGILMDKNYQLQPDNIQMYMYLQIIYKKILLFFNTKMALNSQLKIQLTSSDINQLRLLEKDHIKLIAYQLDFKVMNLDYIGQIIQDLLLKQKNVLMDMLRFLPVVSWIHLKLKYYLK